MDPKKIALKKSRPKSIDKRDMKPFYEIMADQPTDGHEGYREDALPITQLKHM